MFFTDQEIFRIILIKVVVSYNGLLKIFRISPTGKYCNNIYKMLSEYFENKFIFLIFETNFIMWKY